MFVSQARAVSKTVSSVAMRNYLQSFPDRHNTHYTAILRFKRYTETKIKERKKAKKDEEKEVKDVKKEENKGRKKGT